MGWFSGTCTDVVMLVLYLADETKLNTPSLPSLRFFVVFCATASPAAACSLLTSVSEWLFGTAYMVTFVTGLLAIAIFHRRAVLWVGFAMAFVVMTDLALAWVVGGPVSAPMTGVIGGPDAGASEVLLGCNSTVGHVSQIENIWQAISF